MVPANAILFFDIELTNIQSARPACFFIPATVPGFLFSLLLPNLSFCVMK
jgi:hypothetical protein